jgi:hypothetical protein
LAVYRLALLARLNIAFEIKVFKDYPHWERLAAGEQVRKTDAVRRDQGQRKKRQILETVGDAARSDKRRNGEAVENLLDELREQLDEEEFEDTLAERPVNDIVAAILLDYEIEPDWNAVRAAFEAKAAWAAAATAPGAAAAEPAATPEAPGTPPGRAEPPGATEAAEPEDAPEPPPATSGCDPP